MASFLPDTDSEDELPSGWEERVDLEGKVFYVDHVNQLTQWSHPKSGKIKKVSEELPYGWEKVVNKDGSVVFVDNIHHKTTLTDPRIAFASAVSSESDGKFRKFDSCATPSQILSGRDLSGKVAIVTGGNCGIGFETVKALAFHGAKVIMACRNLERANEAVRILQNERQSAKVYAMECDLSNLKSVKNFAQNYQKINEKLHILICNAAVMGLPYQLTEDGFEKTFQVNFLSHVYLVQLLQDVLIASAPSRIVFVSSEGHRFSFLTSQNLSREYLSPLTSRNFVSTVAYSDSKLCLILLTRYMARMYQNYGVTVYSCHPGNAIYTQLHRYWWVYKLLWILVRPFTKSVAQGAATQIYCATAKELDEVSGAYFSNCAPCRPASIVENESMAEKLWKITQEMLKAAT